MKKTGLTIAIVVTVLIAAGLVYLRLKGSDLRKQVTLKDQSSGAKLPGVTEQVLTPGTLKSQASTVLHVNDPKALRELMKQNAWLQDVLGSPLGRGFGHGWAAFLQTKGEDLHARFKGPILSYLLDEAFSSPFAVAWFSSSESPSTAAFIIDGAKTTAFETLSTLTARGVFTATHCPGEETGKDVRYRIVRWLVADQAMYAGLANGRTVIASKPSAVLAGLCVEAAQVKASKPALELALYPDRFGRETQLFGVLLGTKEDVRLPLEIEAGRLMPKGINAALNASHLVAGAPSDELLKLIPEDMPVAALLQLKLPKTLDSASLAAFFKDGSGETLTRQVAVLWDPNGKNEVSLVWSLAGEKDALQTIFRGLDFRVACGHVVVASDSAAGQRIERACKGQSPSRANAAPDVVQGVKAQQSVALHLNLGVLLSQAMVGAYKHEKHNAPLPPEIEQAKKQLEALPFFGFRGRVEGSSLVGEGFRS